MTDFVLVAGAWLGAWEQIARIVNGATPHPGATVAELLRSDRWELIHMDTGHWPMFSEPRELARVLHESASRP
ncbi:hypothetical protein GCM10023086_51050 [Streptomyces venetus]|uniref:Alpha/beta hydrolase n=1 Tax=Streptomyces venetus TaxID=1701086 RepID=A0ABP8GIA6_9ACTN